MLVYFRRFSPQEALQNDNKKEQKEAGQKYTHYHYYYYYLIRQVHYFSVLSVQFTCVLEKRYCRCFSIAIAYEISCGNDLCLLQSTNIEHSFQYYDLVYCLPDSVCNRRRENKRNITIFDA